MKQNGGLSLHTLVGKVGEDGGNGVGKLSGNKLNYVTAWTHFI